MIRKPKRVVSVALPMEIYEKISELAQNSCRTRAGYIRQIIRLYLRHLEESEEMEDWWSIH